MVAAMRKCFPDYTQQETLQQWDGQSHETLLSSGLWHFNNIALVGKAAAALCNYSEQRQQKRANCGTRAAAATTLGKFRLKLCRPTDTEVHAGTCVLRERTVFGRFQLCLRSCPFGCRL